MYSLCIVELEKRVNEFVPWEGIGEITIYNLVSMLPLYTNDMVLLAKCFRICRKLVHCRRVQVSMSQIKATIWRLKFKNNLCFVYIGEPLEMVKSLKSNGFEVPSNFIYNNSLVLKICHWHNGHIDVFLGDVSIPKSSILKSS